jgi:hypothetical protein
MRTRRAFPTARPHQQLEILLTFLTMKFVQWHSAIPIFLLSTVKNLFHFRLLFLLYLNLSDPAVLDL